MCAIISIISDINETRKLLDKGTHSNNITQSNIRR